MSNRVEMTAFIQAVEGKENDLRCEIKELVEKTLSENGCVEFQIFQDSENKNRFILWEVFENKEALNFHLEEPHTQKYFNCGYVHSTNVIKHTKI